MGTDSTLFVWVEWFEEFQGRVFKSLSVIAREITGTRWSGPLFFGLRDRAVPKAKARATAIANTKTGGRA